MYRNWIAFCLVLMASLNMAQAQYAEDVTQDRLLSIAIQGDFKEAERLLGTAQDMALQGDLTPSDMRQLFKFFENTHPDVIAFSKNWVARYPSSPYANVARSIALFEAGAVIRGERRASDTYADAMRLHSALHSQALVHAERAYQDAPRLIAASDTIIKLANTTHTKAGALKVLDEVMRRDPNMRSLTRALHIAHKGWGGSVQQAERLCAKYAPGLEYDYDPLTYCRLYVWDNYYREELDEWVATIMPQINDPTDIPMASFRLQYILDSQTEDRAEDAKFVYDVLTDPYVLSVEEAAQFDLRFAVPYGFDFQNQKHLRGAKMRAWHYLEQDPYNTELITTMLTEEFELSVEYDGGFTHIISTPVSPLKDSIKIDLLHRLLKVSPYDPINWHTFAADVIGTSSLAASLMSDPYEINSIVYSNHGAWEIENHLNNKMGQYIRVQKFNAGEHDEDWRDVIDDLDAQVNCPLIRVYRMRQSKCKAVDSETEHYCYPNEDATKWYDTVLTNTRNRGVCHWERLTPVAGLTYAPVEVDFTELVPGG